MGGRLNWVLAACAIALGALLLHQLLATAWSNRCDPGNSQFYLMKYDGVVGFQPSGQLFTWENDGPDNSFLCSEASLSVSHVGPDVGAMFDATRRDMTANGWSELAPVPNEDFAVYAKTTNGVQLTAVVRKQPFWVEVDIDVPGLHPGEFGF